MFSPNDLIVYGSSGVCRVESVSTRDDLSYAERGRLYYILRPLYQDYTISAPVEGCKVHIRPVLSRGEVDALIDSIPTRTAEPFCTRVQRELTEHYDALIKTHDPDTLLDLTISIHKKREQAAKNGKKLGAVDSRYLARAEELLHGEFAAVLGMRRSDLPEYIENRLSIISK